MLNLSMGIFKYLRINNRIRLKNLAKKLNIDSEKLISTLSDHGLVFLPNDVIEIAELKEVENILIETKSLRRLAKKIGSQNRRALPRISKDPVRSFRVGWENPMPSGSKVDDKANGPISSSNSIRTVRK